MLPDRDLQLLTAYVDGEMSPAEREQVTRLLQKSAAARTLLQALQGDTRRVRDLTRLKLGPDFPAKVLRTLAQNDIPPRPAHRPALAPAPWIGLTIAASVFVMIAAASYWYFSPRQELTHSGTDALAMRPPAGIFGRFSERALNLAVADLGTESTRRTLVTKLHQDNAYHVDLAVQDNGRAVECLATSLRRDGVQVLMPAIMGKTSYCLLAENLKPEELAALLQQLGIQAGRTNVGVDRMIVDVMTTEHRDKLSTLLGFVDKDPRQAARDPAGDLVNKKIIAGKSAGQGTSPIQPRTSQPPERFALVLALPHGDLTGVGNPPELRTFMTRRHGQVAGTVQLFLVIHETKT